MTLELRRGREEDEPGILTLASRALGWRADDPRFALLYRWKHDQSPFGPSPRWVAVEGGRIVGFRVFLRWRFRRGDEVVDAVRAVDTATDPDHRGRGIFRDLTTTAIEELRDEGVAFVFNTPNAQSRPGYLKMGWVEFGRPGVAAVPRPGSLLRTLRARTSAELWSLPCSVGRPAPEALDDPDVAALLDRAPSALWSTDRTDAFLRWRFGLEALHYRVVTDEASDAPAALVVRIRRRGPAVEATIASSTAPSHHRARLVRSVIRRAGADHALIAAERRVDATPSIVLPSLSPLVTWRDLGGFGTPSLRDVALEVGDLELF